jgi:hypothetical protein
VRWGRAYGRPVLRAIAVSIPAAVAARNGDWSRRGHLIPYGAGAVPASLRQCLRRPLRDPRRLLLRRGALHAWVLGEAA